MAPRKNPKSSSPGPRREAKHGGNKNGKKEGLSGSSFFTWFMVIALLGVWTSVAVVWFELVDYEEVLGKLGIYDADGDGDFDVEDAKVLLGLKERSVPEQPTTRDAEEVNQPAGQPHGRAEHKIAEAEPEDEIESLLREVLKSQLEQKSETDEEHVHEETNFQEEEEEENNEIPEVPTVEEDYIGELEDQMPEILERPGSIEEEQAGDYQPQEPEVDDTDVTYEYHTHVEEGTYEPEGPDDTELTLEDALEHNTEPLPEGTEQQDYVDERESENEDFVEARDTDGEPLTEHYYENIQDKADAPDSATELFESVDEREHVEDHVAAQAHETEVPVQADDYSSDDLVDT